MLRKWFPVLDWFRARRRPRQASTAARRRLGIESLEGRRLMAAGVADFDVTYYYSLSDARSDIRNSDGSYLRGVDNSDVVKLTTDGKGGYRHELFFDGSRYGLDEASENIDALAILPDGDLLISTTGRFSVPRVSGDGADIIRFHWATQKWSMYFDGSQVGLSNYVGLDALAVLPDGRLIISTQQDAIVPGIQGKVQYEDLIVFKPSQLGSVTRGSFEMYLDGSDVGLGDEASRRWEDIQAVTVDTTAGSRSLPGLQITVDTKFRVPGVPNVSPNYVGFNDYNDVLAYTPRQAGWSTAGTYTGIKLDGDQVGLRYRHIDALHASFGDHVGVVRGREWLRDFNAEDAEPEARSSYGRDTDHKLTGDFNGDGRTTTVVVRPEGPYLAWHIDDDGDQWPDRVVRFGLATDTPLVGDIDGDGKDDLAIARRQGAYLRWAFNTTGRDHHVYRWMEYGLANDTPVMGDLNGDGRDDLVVVRNNPVGGLTWYVNTSGRNHDVNAAYTRNYGLWGDRVIVGDWNGDGRDNLAVVRSSGSYLVWYFDLDGTTDEAEASLLYGLVGDTIVVGRWAM